MACGWSPAGWNLLSSSNFAAIVALLCSGRAVGRLLTCPTSLIGPVLNLQARHLAEVLQVPGDERGPVCQDDARNEQVAAADLLELFVLQEFVELDGRRRVNLQYGYSAQVVVGFDQPELSLEQLFPILRLEYGIESAAKLFDPGRDGDEDVGGDRGRPFDDSRMPADQVREGIGVEDVHEPSPYSAGRYPA